MLRLFPLNQYSKFIKMMLQYDENYRTVHLYSLGELWKCVGLGVGIEVHILLLLNIFTLIGYRMDDAPNSDSDDVDLDLPCEYLWFLCGFLCGFLCRLCGFFSGF